MTTNPMHQFEVYRIGPEINLGGINLSFTNSSLFMTISGILILSLLFFGTKKKSLIPSKMQLLTEMSYTFIAKMINDTAGSSAKSFFPIKSIQTSGSNVGLAIFWRLTPVEAHLPVVAPWYMIFPCSLVPLPIFSFIDK